MLWNFFNCYLSGRHDYGMWCEPGQIFLGSQSHNARGHFQLDLARIGVAESICLKFLDKL